MNIYDLKILKYVSQIIVHQCNTQPEIQHATAVFSERIGKTLRDEFLSQPGGDPKI